MRTKSDQVLTVLVWVSRGSGWVLLDEGLGRWTSASQSHEAADFRAGSPLYKL